jgi:hypothetical protein
VQGFPPALKGFQYQAELIAPAEEESLLDAIGKLALKEAPYRQFTAKRRIVMFEPVPDMDLAPRSAYSMREEARWGWQHSIAPTPMLRYSVTFRTLREQMLHPRENGYHRQ